MLVTAAALLLFPPKVVWPYFAGVVLLVIGLVMIPRRELSQALGLDKATALGALFLAILMAVFGADHFTFSKEVAAIVPPWMQAHLFWTYFVGVALISAGLSITVGRCSTLAAALLAGMIFCFDLMIHIPNLISSPGDRFKLAIVLREISFSGGALALAHFLHPQFMPVIPLALRMPSWFPGQGAIAYVTGLVLIACGFATLFNWKARLVAAWLGIFVFAIVIAVQLPIMLKQLTDIGSGLNPFVDTLAYSGAALLLAGALPGTEEDRFSKA